MWIDSEGELTISPPSCALSTTPLNKDRDHKQGYFSGMPTNVKDGKWALLPTFRPIR